MGDSENTTAMNIVLGQADSLSVAMDEKAKHAPLVANDVRCPDHAWVIESSKLTLTAGSLTLQLLTGLYRQRREPVVVSQEMSLPWGKVFTVGGAFGAFLAGAYKVATTMLGP